MFTQEPIRTPGGGLTMPPLPPEALTREASDDRLNYVSARAELILVNWVDRLAVFGVSAPMDIDRFERATMSLWRLTAIRKSINALQDSPGSPPDPSLFPSLPTAPFSGSSAGILPASPSPRSALATPHMQNPQPHPPLPP